MSATDIPKTRIVQSDKPESRNIAPDQRNLLSRAGGVIRALRAYFSKPGDWGVMLTVRRCLIAVRLMVLYPAACAKVFNALSSPKLFRLVRKAPAVLIKFLWTIYSNSLSTDQRAQVVANHYEFLQQRLSSGFLERIIDGREQLWRIDTGANALGISIEVMHGTHGEGELAMHFQVDGADIYVLSFVIVPAGLFRLEGDHALFITRLQGTRGLADLVKLATKAVGDVSPALVLVAAVQGITKALGIRHVVGISARAQICTEGEPVTQDFLSAYDDFWTSIEGQIMPSGEFYFPVPFPEKPLSRIKQNHRQRVRIRRAFRREVTLHVKARMECVREP